MATAPSEISAIMDGGAIRPSPWRRVAQRPFAPETLLLYSALSFLFLGRNLIGHFSDRYIGTWHDPGAHMLFLEWWRYAFVHRLNPFDLTAAWYPPGFNLTRTTCIPLAAWALMPLEATLGPIAAYNVGILLCPALSAWSAFLLCRYITRSYWPALAGGYVFGFSSYMLAHSMGHLSLTMVFLLPPAVYLVVRRLRDEITDLKFVALFTLVLLGQFLADLEVVATMTLAGAAFLTLAWLWADNALRRRIAALLPRIAICFATLAVLASPYLYYFFRDPTFPRTGSFGVISASPYKIFAPATSNIFEVLTARTGILPGLHLWEAGEYVGLPLFLLLWSFARSRWREPMAKALTIFFVIACVATFGPYLTIGGRQILPLPWLIMMHLPLLHMVMPARLSVFMFLDLAVIAALWLAHPSRSARVRIGMAVAVIISLLPNLSAAYWTSNADIPAFFRDGLFRSYLSRNETVLVLPYGISGGSDIWLAQARMYFRMAGGYVQVMPMVPPSFDQYPIANAFYNLVDIPDEDLQLKSFLVQKHVSAVIVADQGKRRYEPIPGYRFSSLERADIDLQQRQTIATLFGGLGVEPIHVGGVSLYRVPLDRLQPYAAIAPETLQRRVAAARFATLLVAANRYVKHGYDLKSLTPLKAQELGLLPPRWVGGAYELPKWRDRPIQDELLLGGDKDMAGVGVLGRRPALEELAHEYSRFAGDPGPTPQGVLRVENGLLIAPGIRSALAVDATRWVLLMEFQRDGLARAARAAEQVLAQQAAHPLVN